MKGQRTILAVPHSDLNSPFVGLFEPRFEIRQGETVKADRRAFPNSGFVFTPSQYSEICDAFPVGTLVQLQVEENVTSSLAPTDPNFAKYIVCKNGWGRPDRWAVQLVIDHPFDKDHRTILLDEAPHHPIWLRDTEKRRVFGPFDTSTRKLPDGQVVVELQPPAAVPFAPDRDRHAIASISMHAVDTEDVEGVEYLAFTRAEFARKTVEWVDFSTDEALLELLRDLTGGAAPLSPAQVDRLRNILASGTNVSSPFLRERVQRAAALLDRASTWQEHRHTLVEEFLATGRGEAYIERYLEARADELVDQAFVKYHKKVLERVEQHTAALVNLAVQIEERKQELEELRNVDTEALKARKAEFEKELADHQKRLDDLKAEVGAGEAVVSMQQEVLRQTAALRAVKAEREELIKETQELRQVRERLRKEAARDLNDLRSRLTAIKPYVDNLTGASPRVAAQEELPEPRIARQAPPSLAALVDHAHEALTAANHHVARRDVANVLTGILTSPLTVLAGLPGVGKTSLVTRLAEALGLTPASQFLTIRVPRGWRSRQDVLGYHNPITGEYERAPTGLYALLKWHQDCDHPLPAWVLFDEANLSAPEHYLSDFLPMMDEAADRSLATGAPGETLRVPEQLRFVFTINQDHSVETLTPRVLDRAAVIYVPPPETFEPANTYTVAKAANEGTLTMEALERLLAKVPQELTSSEQATLGKVVRVLHDTNPEHGVPTRLSPRKHRRVLRHTTTLRHMLGVNAGLEALDHAIATHVLPLIRGNGKGYRERLEALAREIETLPASASLLNRMIAAGESAFDTYDFQTIA